MRALVLLLVVLLPASVAPLAWGSAMAPAWEALPELPGARAEVSAAAVGDRIFVVGGVMEDFLPVVSGTEGRVDVYDVASGSWRAGPPLPLAVNHAAAVAVGDRVLVLGGYVGSLFFTPVSATFVLDASLPPEAQRWEPFVPLPTPRGAHAAATDGRFVWVFGGLGEPGALSIGVPEAFHERTVLRLDTQAERPTWEVVGLFPDVRDHLAGAYHEGKVYAIGGRDLQLHRLTGRVDVLDAASGAWSVAPPMPTPRAGIGAAVVGDRIVVVGGETTTRTFDEVEAFDVSAQAWSALPPLPVGRHGVGVVAVDGAVYVEAGGPQPGYAFSALNSRLRLE